MKRAVDATTSGAPIPNVDVGAWFRGSTREKTPATGTGGRAQPDAADVASRTIARSISRGRAIVGRRVPGRGLRGGLVQTRG